MYNHEPNKRERIWINAGENLGIIFGQATKTKRIVKWNFDCQEDNLNSFSDCLNMYYLKKLGCSLPWAKKKKQNYPDCTEHEKFREFKNLSMSILDQEIKKEIENEGCFVPNCEQRTWEIESKELWESETNSTEISFQIFHKTKLLVRREVRLCTFLNFYAEVGGYFGLFLGESLVSYFLIGWRWLKLIANKCKSKYSTKEESVYQ